MKFPMRKSNDQLKLLNNLLIDMPSPQNLSTWWNFGSILSIMLIIQIITGLFLAMFYIPDTLLAFESITHITRDINYGWLLRNMHANSASMFFIAIYLHMGRGIYYQSFHLTHTWMIGVIIYIVLMATAFMGYVLPWGQMSFWGATVITSLLSAIPYFGTELVNWVWGGFAVDSPTLTRFFALHFILPFVLIMLSIIHIFFLHSTGSKNPLGINSNVAKVTLHPFFTMKDLFGFITVFIILTTIVMFSPDILGDPENFIPANPMITPIHIKPEWYFLWLYAILRAIPNKLGGVILMFSAMMILMLMPIIYNNNKPVTAFYPETKPLFWTLFSLILLLTWIGSCPVEPPYESLGLLLTMTYFSLFFMIPLILKKMDKTMN